MHMEEGQCTLHLRVLRRAAGEYSLALRCAGEDMLLGDSLLQVAVLAAPVAVSRCRVRCHEQNHATILLFSLLCRDSLPSVQKRCI